MKTKTPGVHVDALLRILRRRYDKLLPQDHRALCRTPRKSNVQAFDDTGSTHKYFGIGRHLKSYLQTHKKAPTDIELMLDFNIDGVPVSTSSNQSLLPLLMSIVGCKKVYMVACYCGQTKLVNYTKYLEEFCIELKELLDTGFEHDQTLYVVSIRVFPCDAPARADILNIYHHSARKPCHKCKIVSKRYMNRQIFLSMDNEARTAAEFNAKADRQHYHGPSALDNLNLDVPRIFVIDYMHAVLLGVVKHLLELWFFDRKHDYSLSRLMITRMNQLQNVISVCLPREFSRAARTFKLTSRFKATELRTLLLYTLPILLKGRLREKFYRHFLLLHCAIRILCSPNLFIENLNCARSLIRDFVKQIPNLYSKQNVSYNVHCLLHLCDDVHIFLAPLDELSCFKFENFLQTLKNTPRSGHRVLEQISNRIREKHALPEENCAHSHEESVEIVVSRGQHVSAKLNGFTISNKSPNNYCVIRYENIGLCRIEKIHIDGLIDIRRVMSEPLFLNPIDSGELCNSVVMNGPEENGLSNTIQIPISSKRVRKACHFAIEDHHYFVEMI